MDTIFRTRVTAVEGNTQWLDGGAMFGNAPRAVWSRWMPPDDRGRVKLACRALLIEIADKTILCETGIGNFFAPDLADRYGVTEAEHVLRDNLAALGIAEEAIDYVILSHLHFDHAGGLLPSYAEMQSDSWDLLFPNAQYVVGKRAWERACQPHARDRASYLPALNAKLEASGRLIIVEGAHLPGVFEDQLSFRYSDGHTPGQMHTVLRGEQQTITFAGDLIPGTAWVHAPISMGYDRFPEQLIDEKKDLYDTIVSDQQLLFFTHDPEVKAAQVVQNEKKRFVTEAPLVELVRYEL